MAPQISKDYSQKGMAVRFAAPKAVLMQMFRETDFMHAVDEKNIFATVR